MGDFVSINLSLSLLLLLSPPYPIIYLMIYPCCLSHLAQPCGTTLLLLLLPRPHKPPVCWAFFAGVVGVEADCPEDPPCVWLCHI